MVCADYTSNPAGADGFMSDGQVCAVNGRSDMRACAMGEGGPEGEARDLTTPFGRLDIEAPDFLTLPKLAWPGVP